MSKVITFGEIMLRLAPEGFYRFVQAKKFDASFGGGEANVSLSLANLGIETSFVTNLPKNEIGQMALNVLRANGVGTEFINRTDARMGIYFLERGASQRASKVIYDRSDSSIFKARNEDFNWDKIFEGASYFHLTGITPALNDNLATISLEAVKKAKEKGLVVSVDLNFRKKLWTKEKAKEVMSKICKYVDICIANEEDAKNVFGIEAKNTNIEKGDLDYTAYKEVAKILKETFSFKKVAITLRESISASRNNWSALLYSDSEYYFSKKYEIDIVDRVGGGDSFSAGLLYSLINGYSNEESIEFAVAASCLKHSIEGDFNLVSKEEILSLVKGDGSGRVQR